MTPLPWALPAYERVAVLVGAETGLSFSPARCLDAETGIRRAMAKAGVSDVAAYLQGLESGSIPLEDLIGELTVGETYFFRDPAQFAVLREEILPTMAGPRHPDRGIRAWSAGCSSGEEAYSLAILFEEEGLAGSSRILATDLSKAALEKARRGVYGPWALRASDAEFKKRYFHATGSRYRIDERFRKNLDFEVHNLAQESLPGPASAASGMDLILCRNVLIYLDSRAIEKVARRLVEALAPGGWILTGPSDPPLRDFTPCAAVVTKAGIFYQRIPEAVRAGGDLRFSTEPLPAASPGRADLTPEPRTP
ncbi:MAG TPA: protein-glutamate O-methyltransferase CheR, partial [Planctomycetota bacterium]|nr:protein-glutamate O-methyltransferase CheR [Planctomycetota bacterium]